MPFSLIFQCLEQEKHVLRRKLSEAESERDVRIQDLESDYNDLKKKLMSQVINFMKSYAQVWRDCMNGLTFRIVHTFFYGGFLAGIE